jgi:hypothetical protein
MRLFGVTSSKNLPGGVRSSPLYTDRYIQDALNTATILLVENKFAARGSNNEFSIFIGDRRVAWLGVPQQSIDTPNENAGRGRN